MILKVYQGFAVFARLFPSVFFHRGDNPVRWASPPFSHVRSQQQGSQADLCKGRSGSFPWVPLYKRHVARTRSLMRSVNKETVHPPSGQGHLQRRKASGCTLVLSAAWAGFLVLEVLGWHFQTVSPPHRNFHSGISPSARPPAPKPSQVTGWAAPREEAASSLPHVCDPGFFPFRPGAHTRWLERFYFDIISSFETNCGNGRNRKRRQPLWKTIGQFLFLSKCFYWFF